MARTTKANTMAAVSEQINRTERALDRKAKAAKEPKRCECGCGRTTSGGTWAPGHDAVRKGELLRRFDSGDTKAGEELVRRAWRTEVQLAARSDRSLDANERRAMSRDARLAALVARRDTLQTQIDAITAEGERVEQAGVA